MNILDSEKNNNRKISAFKLFLEKAHKVHYNENLDYSEAIYINNRTPIKIIDHDLDENGIEYGEYWQTPSNHLKGQSHPKKRNKKISKNKALTTDEIIKRFKEVHKGENLDYSFVEYVNMHTKVKIISHDLDENGVEYGEFWQEPAVHLKGCTHPLLANKKRGDNSRYTNDEFIRKCKDLYCNDRYSYDEVNYINSKTKVNIFCNKLTKGKPHGYFLVSPDLFLQGKGCPKCGNQLSNAENEIYEYIINLVGYNNVIKRNTTILDGYELDIYIPSKNIAFEYNGLKWHSEEFGKDKWYHYNKTKKCNDKGITLIQIFEDEYIENKNLVLDKIKHFLSQNYDKTKIYGRNCNILTIDKNVAKEFLKTYHIQGFSKSTVYLGAFYNEHLIAVMTFIKCNNTNEWELNRFASDYNYVCCGIGGKLFKFFTKNYTYSTIKSFLDIRWHNINKLNIYDKLGFIKEKILPPDYYYTKGQYKRYHKFGFRKKILNKKYNLPLSMTENEMTKELGYYKIWNCGLIKYVYKK